jgi:peptide-methionine (S)-S-oxide reductase
MKNIKKTWRVMAVFQLLMVLGISQSGLYASGQSESKGDEMKSESMEAVPEKRTTAENIETAVFAGGCFWGVEAVFESLKGVENVVSGYSGGSADTATYYSVGTGKTGHAESVEIAFDPGVISFETLLEVFFAVAHDPTQLNYQGPDHGSEYRSVVFYTTESQRTSTLKAIKELDSKKVYPSKIVTEVVPLTEFYPAEEYHQNFIKLNPTQGYVVYWDLPKLEELEKKYPDLLRMK